MWDMVFFLLGFILVECIGFIDCEEFDWCFVLVFELLVCMLFFDGQLLNKLYNMCMFEMVNYDNLLNVCGIGWLVIDIGWLFVLFNVFVWYYLEYIVMVCVVIDCWDMMYFVQDVIFYGVMVEEGEMIYVQEGWIGYEEYVVKFFIFFGIDVQKVLRMVDYFKYVDVYGVDVLMDCRWFEDYDVYNYVVSELYIFDGFEFGWDFIFEEFVYCVYLVQQ